MLVFVVNEALHDLAQGVVGDFFSMRCCNAVGKEAAQGKEAGGAKEVFVGNSSRDGGLAEREFLREVL